MKDYFEGFWKRQRNLPAMWEFWLFLHYFLEWILGSKFEKVHPYIDKKLAKYEVKDSSKNLNSVPRQNAKQYDHTGRRM